MRGGVLHELQFDLSAAHVPADARREAAQSAMTATRRSAAWPSHFWSTELRSGWGWHALVGELTHGGEHGRRKDFVPGAHERRGVGGDCPLN